jgi:branched-chain amino acid transport system permease protein
VNLASTKILAFVISAAYAGFAGGLYAHTFRYISPEFFSLGLTITLLAMVLLGGRGSIVGVVIGVVALTVLPESLRFINQYYMVVFGLGIWMLVMFLPGGLASIIPRVRRVVARYRNRVRAQSPTPDKRSLG